MTTHPNPQNKPFSAKRVEQQRVLRDKNQRRMIARAKGQKVVLANRTMGRQLSEGTYVSPKPTTEPAPE